MLCQVHQKGLRVSKDLVKAIKGRQGLVREELTKKNLASHFVPHFNRPPSLLSSGSFYFRLLDAQKACKSTRFPLSLPILLAAAARVSCPLINEICLIA